MTECIEEGREEVSKKSTRGRELEAGDDLPRWLSTLESSSNIQMSLFGDFWSFQSPEPWKLVSVTNNVFANDGDQKEL